MIGEYWRGLVRKNETPTERERSEVNNESYTTSTHTTRIRQMPPIQDLNYVESSNLNYLH